MIKEIFIRNMVCDRCIKVLRTEFKNEDIDLIEIELGRIKVGIKNESQFERIIAILEDDGFSIIKSPEKKLVEKVKIELIHILEQVPFGLEENLSSFLSKKLKKEYSKISKTFSFIEEVTIEKYFIKLKIEKVKELIQSQEYNFTQISQMLDYKDLNHLSKQFKNETGMSLTDYKLNRKGGRKSLDKII